MLIMYTCAVDNVHSNYYIIIYVYLHSVLLI